MEFWNEIWKRVKSKSESEKKAIQKTSTHENNI